MDDLDERVLKAFYPRQYSDGRYTGHSHEVLSRMMPFDGDKILYEIESAHGGKNRYRIDFLEDFLKNPSKYDNQKELDVKFRALLSEVVARITVKEWLRGIKSAHNITSSGFLKPEERKGDIHVATFPTPKNILIHKRGIHRTIAEYDGVIEYSSRFRGKMQKGIIAIEAKTGHAEDMQKAKYERWREKIVEKRIEPLIDLFPDHHIDWILMAPPEQIYSHGNHVKKRQLKPYVGELVEFLSEYNVGLIPFSFNESQKSLDSMIHQVRKSQLAMTVNGNVPLNRSNKVDFRRIPRVKNQSYAIHSNHLYLFTGNRVDGIIDIDLLPKSTYLSPHLQNKTPHTS